MQIVQRGNEIQEIRCEGGAERADSFRDGLLYSTQEFAGGGAILPEKLAFFNYKVGEPVSRSATIAQRNSNDNDTNMQVKSFMPANQEMWVAALYPEVFALTDDSQTGSGGVAIVAAIAPIPSADTLKWLEFSTVVQFTVGVGVHQPLMEAPFGFFSSAADAMYAASGESPGGPAISIGSLGYVGGLNARVSDRLIHLNAKDKILGNLFFPRGATPLAAGAVSPAYTCPQSVRLRWYLRGPRVFPLTGGSAR